MSKQVSLRKMWFLCNQALKENLANDRLNEDVFRAYKLWQASDLTNVKTLVEGFGPSLGKRQIEPLAIRLENLLELPIKDSDILVESKDKNIPLAPKSSLIFYLHNIRSGFNIGSMIRLADGFHIHKVILGGYTAPPENAHVLRASLGAEKNISIEQEPREKEFELIHQCSQTENYQVVALETAEPSHDLTTFTFPQKTILVVGNEKHGLPPSLLQRCDDIVKIPMYGAKNSLNVVSALSIASYEWTKQCR